MQTTKRMKKIITFFLLCLAVNSYSQKYKLTYSGSVNTVYCQPDPFINGASSNSISLNNVILRARCGNPESAINQVIEINYKPNKITSIVRYKANNSTTSSTYTDIIDLNLNHCDSWNGNENLLPNTYSEGNYFSFTIEPIINIVPPSIDPSCSVFISADNAGFETDIYNWEFQTLADDWKPLPTSSQGKPSFEINLTDLFGANAYQYFNKPINFRIRYCQTRFTDPVSFTFIPCSPNVEVPIEKENTTCAYNNDGIVSLTFDRPLINDESFSFSFFKNNVLITTPFYTVDTATNKKYTFSGLAAGNYYVIYQTFIDSQPTSINKEPYPSFTINPATPLTFKLQNPKNPSCFGAEDGSVEVLITNGIPKNFELNGKPATKVKISDNLYRIDGLGANELGHKIKVTDANNCIDTNAND